jgi:hypothetical protein
MAMADPDKMRRRKFAEIRMEMMQMRMDQALRHV